MQQLFFNGYLVKVQRRLFQRSVNIIVDNSGKVKITAGKTTSLKVLQNFLEKNKSWIEGHLKKVEQDQLKYPPKKVVSGEFFLFLGRLLEIDIISSPNKRTQVKLVGCKIIVSASAKDLSEPLMLQASLNKFYKKSGVEVLKKVIHEQSLRMNLFPKKLSFRAQKTRWGSCSSEGNISMNWKLIFAPPEVLEYVVIHELAHLKHQDHSQKFWNLVQQFSPDYKEHKNWLRENSKDIDRYHFC